MSYLLGIDLGTTNSLGCVYNGLLRILKEQPVLSSGLWERRRPFIWGD